MSASALRLERWNWQKRPDEPLHWREDRRVEVAPDLFGPDVLGEAVDRVFAVMALSPQHTFLVLTKGPERMREYVNGNRTQMDIERHAFRLGGDRPWPGWPLPNAWLGVSVEDQPTADARIPVLLDTPAAVRFVSAEPLLGAIRFDMEACSCRAAGEWDHRGETCHGIDWVIAGGESGRGARPCNVEWIRGIVRQCRAAGVPVFVKQVGTRPYEPLADMGNNEQPVAAMERHGWPVGVGGRMRRLDGHWEVHPRDRKGGEPSEWPEDLRVREFPGGPS